MFDGKAMRLHLPGTGDDGDLASMREETEPGTHRFVAAQAGRPFPAELSAAGHDGVSLDRTLLAHIARTFEAQESSSRRLFALDLQIVRCVPGKVG
jgi:hypothetical protein